jgi:hypothetical protein
MAMAVGDQLRDEQHRVEQGPFREAWTQRREDQVPGFAGRFRAGLQFDLQENGDLTSGHAPGSSSTSTTQLLKTAPPLGPHPGPRCERSPIPAR